MAAPEVLSPQEKAAGRRFRDTAQADLEASLRSNPPTFLVPGVIAAYRHDCPGRAGRTLALELREVYVSSPAYPDLAVPAGRFAFTYRVGRCIRCGATARCETGRLVVHRAPQPTSAAGTAGPAGRKRADKTLTTRRAIPGQWCATPPPHPIEEYDVDDTSDDQSAH